MKFKKAKWAGTVGPRAVSLSLAWLAPLGYADSTFWRVGPRAKMGGLTQWIPLASIKNTCYSQPLSIK